MSNTALPAELAQGREQFLSLVASLRPELHRYSARLTGSVIEGEDIVQETLAKAFYAMSLATEVPPLRPWLFRIAHNTAMDFLKSHARRLTDPDGDVDAIAESEAAVDPAVVRAALSRFLALPVAQRSAVILKDVLGHSLEETADTMGATVPAVKAALVRGRQRLREELATAEETAPSAAMPPSAARADLERYAALFNARDWDALRALVGEDCRLDLVAKSVRRGKAVGAYFGRYEREPGVRFGVVRLDGRDVLGAFVDGAARPAYFVLLEWVDGRVAFIRDYRYSWYVGDEAAAVPA